MLINVTNFYNQSRPGAKKSSIPVTQNKNQKTRFHNRQITPPSDFRYQVPDPTFDLQIQKRSIPPRLPRARPRNGASDPKGLSHGRTDPIHPIAYLPPPARELDTLLIHTQYWLGSKSIWCSIPLLIVDKMPQTWNRITFSGSYISCLYLHWGSQVFRSNWVNILGLSPISWSEFWCRKMLL